VWSRPPRRSPPSRSKHRSRWPRPPAKLTESRSATFAWTGGPASATYTCGLDGSALTACTSPATYEGLRDGSHTFVVRAKALGKPSSTSYTWQVDATPPAAPQVSPLPSPTSATSAAISFTSTDQTATSFTCSLDGVAATPCTSPYPVSNLSEGSHTVFVRAQDSFGRISLPGSVTWVVDSTAPGSLVVTPPQNPTKDDLAAVVSFTSNDPAATFTCSVDNGPMQSCTSPHTVTGPFGEGVHTVTVQAYDGAGNGTEPVTAAWVVDLTPPATPTVLTGPPARTNQATAEFVLGTVDGSGTLRCELDGIEDDCPADLRWTALVDGPHTMRFRSVDLAGNASAWTQPHAWTVDTTAPAPARITSGPPSPSNDTLPVLNFEPVDPSTFDHFECELDGSGSWTACDSGEWPWTGSLSGERSHDFAVRVHNDTGGVSDPAVWTWVLDTVAPPVPVFSSAPPVSTTEDTALFAFVSEPGATYTCAVDGADATVCTSPLTLRSLPLGAHSLVVVAEDAAFNSSQARHDWTVVAPDPGSGSGGGSGGGTGAGTGTGTGATPAPATPTIAGTAVSTSFAPSRALLGRSRVEFSQPVTGVSSSTVHLRASGSTTDLRVALSCEDAAGASVSCATGAVRAVLVRPVAPLVPGQTYSLSTAPGLRDAALVAVPSAAASFRASTDEQETSPRVRAGWRVGKSGAAFGRRYVTESAAGATATVRFSGPKVTWYTMTGPAQGMAKVFVDGKARGRVNTYSATEKWRVARTLTGLGKGTHVLRVVALGRKGSTKGTGTGVVVDAVRVGKRLVANPAVRTTWGKARSSAASRGAYAVSSLAKATSAFTFRGTAVSWVTATGPAMGKAKVYVDGVLKARVDNYGKKAVWNVRRTVSGLSNGVHTVKVVVLGAKRPAAKGTNVVVDRWIVR